MIFLIFVPANDINSILASLSLSMTQVPFLCPDLAKNIPLIFGNTSVTPAVLPNVISSILVVLYMTLPMTHNNVTLFFPELTLPVLCLFLLASDIHKFHIPVACGLASIRFVCLVDHNLTLPVSSLPAWLTMTRPYLLRPG